MIIAAYAELNNLELNISKCKILTQVGFAELRETVDDRANIGGTIIGAPIVDRPSGCWL